MTIAIVLIVVFMVVWAFVLGCAELERKEERWQKEQPDDKVKRPGG